MDELTDYEINKRLAEIAGADFWPAKIHKRERLYVDGEDTGTGEGPPAIEWDPLHDWSQLGPLMEQSDITVGAAWDEETDTYSRWSAMCFPPGAPEDAEAQSVLNPDLKRAIALSIIAAHDEG